MENYFDRLKKYKKNMHKKPTIKEASVNIFLKEHRLKFRSQYVIPPYIVDFFIPERGLVIELDGSIHNKSQQKEIDYKREDYLMSLGLIVQRFSNGVDNNEILKNINIFPLIPKAQLRLIKRRIVCLNTLAEKTDIFKDKFNNAQEALKDVKNINRLRF